MFTVSQCPAAFLFLLHQSGILYLHMFALSTISVHLSVILNHAFSSQLSLPSHSVPVPPIRSSRFWRSINLVVYMFVIYFDELTVFCYQVKLLCDVTMKAGLGTKEELGQLSLKHEENFCMGGPGMIVNRETLVRVVPHVNYCLQHLLTSHEDVELGRCIHQFAGVTCTWSYEVLSSEFHRSKTQQF